MGKGKEGMADNPWTELSLLSLFEADGTVDDLCVLRV